MPLVFAVALALLLCVCLLLAGTASQESEKTEKLKIAVSGDTDNDIMQVGIAALRSFDDTRFSMELVEMPEAEARRQLQSGALSAMVVFPEDFLERALRGDIDRVTFVTTPGAQTVVTMLKDEVTKVIADIVIACEKGVYAARDAVKQNDLDMSAGQAMSSLSMDYAAMLLSRADVYTLTELGISQGLGMEQYYACSMTVVLLMLFGMCFVMIGIKNDYALQELLASRGLCSHRQVLCEYLVHLLAFVLLILTLLLACGLILPAVGIHNLPDFLPDEALVSLCARTVLVLGMLAAFNIMVFELSGNLISGVLLHFFCCLGFSYASGCFYPVYTLPLALQRIAPFLPTGVAREYLEGAFTGQENIPQLIGLLIFSAVFVGVAVLARQIKIQRLRR